MPSEFVKEPTPALTAAIEAFIDERHSALTPGQRSALTSRLMDDPLISLSRDFGTSLNLATADITLREAVRDNPRLVSRIPTVNELVEQESARHLGKLGTAMGPESRIALARRLAGLTDDERLGLLPDGTKLDAVSTAAPTGTPSGKKSYSSMTTEELDGEVLERFGKSRHDMTIGERINYHKAIKALDVHVATPVNDMVNAGVRTEDQLSPSERIRRFRESEKLKGK